MRLKLWEFDQPVVVSTLPRLDPGLECGIIRPATRGYGVPTQGIIIQKRVSRNLSIGNIDYS